VDVMLVSPKDAQVCRHPSYYKVKILTIRERSVPEL
jgi:hypothetical protein